MLIKHKRSIIIRKKILKKFYQKQTKKKLVDECVLLYEHVQKLGLEKMFNQLKNGLK